MKRLRLAFYGFFLIFNLLYVVYNISSGFDFSKMFLPLLIILACSANIYFILKSKEQ